MGIEWPRVSRGRAVGTFWATIGSQSPLIAAATMRSNWQPNPDLPLGPLYRHRMVLHDTSIPGPISRELWHGAVGTLISGHDVSGAGRQTPGRVTRPITTMMPV
jgi:hypothetical protein